MPAPKKPLNLGEALLLLWLAGLVANGLARISIWLVWPWFLGVGALLVLAWLDRRARSTRGYWIEHLSPAVLRAGANDFAVVYHEGAEQMFFYGHALPDGERLCVPAEEAWTDCAPAFARERRAEIVKRLLADAAVKRATIVGELPAPGAS
jgi:hypothetical protein